jgi:hypothetical protein
MTKIVAGSSQPNFDKDEIALLDSFPKSITGTHARCIATYLPLS